jgi:hypothetical protein
MSRRGDVVVVEIPYYDRPSSCSATATTRGC